MGYGIFELMTGYVDGWFPNVRNAVAARKFWDEIRPQYKHVVFKRVDNFELTDAIYLPNADIMPLSREYRVKSEFLSLEEIYRQYPSLTDRAAIILGNGVANE